MNNAKCSRSAFSWPIVLSIAITIAIGFLAAGCGAGSSGGAEVRSSGDPADGTTQPTATATGFAGVAFGTPQKAAQGALVKLLGDPTKVADSGLPASCGVSASAEWKGLSAFYFKGEFAGYEYRGADVEAPSGLNVGMSVAAAKQAAGRDFSTSFAQGGSWELETSAGKVFGYLDAVPPKGRIATIDAGSVGCPSMTP
jgi:hypothetical protein